MVLSPWMVAANGRRNSRGLFPPPFPAAVRQRHNQHPQKIAAPDNGAAIFCVWMYFRGELGLFLYEDQPGH
jgi:hypothetical protein